MSRQLSQIYLGVKDIDSPHADKVLDRLNSLNSIDEIVSAISAHNGRRVISFRVAQRILNTKLELGRFEDLDQLATVAGVGAKRFTAIIHGLGNNNR